MRAFPVPVQHINRTIAALALIAAGTSAAPSPASAATLSHCVSTASTIATAAGTPTCFSTFAEAIAHATGGAVRLPANATTVTEAQLQHRIAPVSAEAATEVIGISYKNTGYSGATHTHTAPGGCDNHPDVDYYFHLPTAWNDNIGSAVAYSGCRGLYWENGHGTHGSGAGVYTDWSGGAMNDQASFIDWV